MMSSTRYTTLCNICLKNVFSDSLHCASCLTQVHKRCARLNDAFNNSSNVDDYHWNCKDCIELSSIFNINDNNNTNVALNTCHCSYFYNEKVNPDINLKNIFYVNTPYFTTEQFENTMHDTKGISIIHINCRSLYANFEKLKILLDNLEFVFDVIALTETWINEDNANIFSLDGYVFCHTNRTNKKGGGVALYINNRIQYQIIDNLSINIDNCLECIAVKLLLKQNVIVSSIYRQPNSKINYFTNLIDSMFRSIKGILFLCEDFNINLLDYKLNNHTQNFVDLLFSMSLFPLINRPTRLSNQHASIIDNIFTNAINKNINCGIIMDDISDHFPIFCISELDVKKQLNNNNELFYRENTNDNIKKLNNFLTLQNWQTVYNANNVNESYNNFIEIFLHLYNISCPIRHCK